MIIWHEYRAEYVEHDQTKTVSPKPYFMGMVFSGKHTIVTAVINDNPAMEPSFKETHDLKQLTKRCIEETLR